MALVQYNPSGFTDEQIAAAREAVRAAMSGKCTALLWQACSQCTVPHFAFRVC